MTMFEPGDVVTLKTSALSNDGLFMTVSEIVDDKLVMCIYYNKVTGKTEEESFPIVVLSNQSRPEIGFS